MTSYYVAKDDNSVSVFGGPAVQDAKLGWVVPCVKTFPYYGNGNTSADAIEKAKFLAADLNAKQVKSK